MEHPFFLMDDLDDEWEEHAIFRTPHFTLLAWSVHMSKDHHRGLVQLEQPDRMCSTGANLTSSGVFRNGQDVMEATLKKHADLFQREGQQWKLLPSL